MVKQLSPSELSTLWLLHDRHTTRQAVEKAIELGLPLWPEAVHLARACHRSNMDLAGGAYYVVGSDFVDNEDSSQYDYHELGMQLWAHQNPDLLYQYFDHIYFINLPVVLGRYPEAY
ncbi:unnamed protein product, partial [Cylicostephanus goldi]